MDTARVISDWRSSIAHADIADWVIVAAYVIAASLSARAARHAEAGSRDSMFWRIIAMLLVLLGINELLDLQTLLTVVGREHAKANGWYEDRRWVQYVFVLALGAAAVLAGVALLRLIGRTHASVRLALAGLILIGLFVLLRAASFHHLNEILGRGAPEFSWGSVQEAAGILIVAIAAELYARRDKESLS